MVRILRGGDVDAQMKTVRDADPSAVIRHFEGTTMLLFQVPVFVHVVSF